MTRIKPSAGQQRVAGFSLHESGLYPDVNPGRDDCNFNGMIIHYRLIRSFLGVILLIFAESEEDLCQSDMSLW